MVQEAVQPETTQTQDVSQITMKSLLEAGVHFGHQKRRWNPKMSEYIFAHRNGIHIIDLQKTLYKIEEAAEFLTEVAAEGKRFFSSERKNRLKTPLLVRQKEAIHYTFLTDGLVEHSPILERYNRESTIWST